MRVVAMRTMQVGWTEDEIVQKAMKSGHVWVVDMIRAGKSRARERLVVYRRSKQYGSREGSVVGP